MVVEYRIVFPDGTESTGQLDWNNRNAVREFAGIADKAIRCGASVTTRQV